MNRASDPKTMTAGTPVPPHLDVRALEAATGVLTIDLDAIAENWSRLESRAVPAECAAVVKADAYGCGLPQVTRKLAAAGCKTFFVATLDEAKQAREAAPSAAIYVLDGFFANCGDVFARYDVRPVIGDLSELAEWDAYRRTSGWKGAAAIHIDTGMNRLGISVNDARGLVPRIQKGDHGIALVGVIFLNPLGPQSGRAVDSMTPQVTSQLQVAGVPDALQGPILAGYKQCAQDRASETDPTVTPASCKQAPPSSLSPQTAAQVERILEADAPTVQAKAFTHALQIGLYVVVGLALLVTLMMFSLPKKAKPQEV